MKNPWPFWLGFVISLVGCATTPRVIPDPRIPHQLAKPARVIVRCEAADQTLIDCPWQLNEGDWCAKQRAVEE